MYHSSESDQNVVLPLPPSRWRPWAHLRPINPSDRAILWGIVWVALGACLLVTLFFVGSTWVTHENQPAQIERERTKQTAIRECNKTDEPVACIRETIKR